MKEKKNAPQGLQIQAKTFISIVLVLLAIMIFAGVLTRVLPQGEFQRIEENGRQVVVSGTYQEIDEERLPVWRWFTAPFEVFASDDALTAIVIIVFIVLIGGTFLILQKSNIINYLISKVVKKFENKKYLMLAMLTLICMLLGSTMGILEETVPLVPIIIGLSLFLGWDTLMGMGMSILAVCCGFAAGTLNPFTVGIAQSVAGLPMFSGVLVRFAIFLVVYGILLAFLVLYAKKIEKNPQKSLTYETDLLKREQYQNSLDGEILNNKKIKKATIILGVSLAVIVAYIILTVFVKSLSSYSLVVMMVVLTCGGLIAGKVSGYREKGMMKDFGKGILDILPSTLLIILAMSAKQIIVNGKVIDTVLYKAYLLLEGTSPIVTVLLMYLFVLFIEFFISSGTAKAVLVIPIIAPLADMIGNGLTRQTVVQAFCFGDGFTNMFFPTCALLLVSLGIAGVSYGKWFRWTWKLQAIIFVVTALILLLLVKVGFN